MDIFTMDSNIHSFNAGISKDPNHDDSNGSITDIFAIPFEGEKERRNQNCAPKSSDDLHPFFSIDDEDNNIRKDTRKCENIIDIFALDNDKQQPPACIDFNDGKYSRAKRESNASLEHYNADFIAYFSDDTTDDFEFNTKHLELESAESLNLTQTFDVPGSSRSSSDENEHDRSFKIHDEEGDTSLILEETIDDGKSDDTLSEGSQRYTHDEGDYYYGSDTSTIESSEVEDEVESEEAIPVEVMGQQEETAEGTGKKETSQEDEDTSQEDEEDSDAKDIADSEEDGKREDVRSPVHDQAWWLKDDVIIMLFPGESMKIRSKIQNSFS